MNLRHCEIVCDVDKLKVDLQQTFMKYKTIKKWAYIIHDKDDTRPHYHIYLHFGKSSVDTEKIAEWFQVPPNFVEKIKGRFTDALEYLTHSNESQKNKHQYDRSLVTANFDFIMAIENSKIVGNFEKYSYAEMLTYIDSLPVVEKTAEFSRLKKLWELECRCLCLTTDRDVEVVFITGTPGSGKTTYAKRMLKALKYDFCISSSSNDPFQDYLGQRAIVLDDMRDKSFELEDLLKILDNNTNSSIKSRFANKVFNGKMIVITSSVPINYWYSQHRFNSSEDLKQLYRRISSYIVVTKEVIKVYQDGLQEDGQPSGVPICYENKLDFTFKQQEKKKTDLKSIFDEIV